MFLLTFSPSPALVRSICRLAWDSCSRPERDVEVEGRRGARTRVWSTGPKRFHRRAASSVSNSLSLGPWCSWREPRPVLVLGIALSLSGNNEGHQNTRILSCHIHENGGAAVSLKSVETSLKSPLMWPVHSVENAEERTDTGKYPNIHPCSRMFSAA